MRGLASGLPLAAAAVMALSTPIAAQAQYYHHYHHYHHYGCRRHAVAGTIVGGVTGGVIGNLVTHGHGPGTLIGAGVGAVAGHQIAKHNC
jgi:hypothetical protein